MQKRMLGLILAAVAATAAAEGQGLDHYYGNTWEMRRPEETTWIYVNADGTWDGIFGGTFYAGLNWREENGRTCFFTQPSPDEGPGEPVCFRDLAGRKVGETWKVAVDGRDKVWDATLYKGRAVPPTAGKSG